MMDGGAVHWAEPAVDGSEEAKQVEMFLESEHTAMQKAFDDDLNDLNDPCLCLKNHITCITKT